MIKPGPSLGSVEVLKLCSGNKLEAMFFIKVNAKLKSEVMFKLVPVSTWVFSGFSCFLPPPGWTGYA